MEMNELRYFLAVAKTQNVNKSAEILGISAGSISKAVYRLEAELGAKLFERVGRNIKITSKGRSLQAHAARILDLESQARLEVGGSAQEFEVVICGEELLLSHYSLGFVSEILTRYPEAHLRLLSCRDKDINGRILSGDSHLAFTTVKPSTKFQSKVLGSTKFCTVVGKGHPLYKQAKAGTVVPVAKLLDHPFVVPSEDILGKTSEYQSLDGWRDDKFQRKIRYKVSSIKLLESLVFSGKAVAYLPDYLVEQMNLPVLDISGCPYYCEQKIYAVCRDPKQIGWLNQIW